MKTAISVPDGTFGRASRRASELGVSRSQLFSTAMDRYLDELDRQSLTEQINLALDAAGRHDDSSRAAVGLGRRLLASHGGDGW